MRKYLIFSILLIVISCNSQTKLPHVNQNDLIGGPCEGCENFNKDKPSFFAFSDTSVLWKSRGEKLHIRGKVQNRRGDAVGQVEIYYWHTNSDGKYVLPNGIEQDDEQFPQGWVKTDENGRFDIFTIRPGAYPNRNIPAHIHLFVKEPELPNAYYVDDLVFDDDRLLTSKYRQAMENRGGSGVLRLNVKGGISTAEYTMVLGLNIPNHPDNFAEKSGLPVGVDSPSFTPFHAFGVDEGKRVCPVCKYGKGLGIIHFTKRSPTDEAVKKWINFYELLSEKYQTDLKVYVVFEGSTERIELLKNIGNSQNLKRLALTVIPSFRDKESDVYLNEINDSVENTLIVYSNSRIIFKLIDAAPSTENTDIISRVLTENSGSLVFSSIK